jgi:hypothetical protein
MAGVCKILLDAAKRLDYRLIFSSGLLLCCVFSCLSDYRSAIHWVHSLLTPASFIFLFFSLSFFPASSSLQCSDAGRMCCTIRCLYKIVLWR